MTSEINDNSQLAGPRSAKSHPWRWSHREKSTSNFDVLSEAPRPAYPERTSAFRYESGVDGLDGWPIGLDAASKLGPRSLDSNFLDREGTTTEELSNGQAAWPGVSARRPMSTFAGTLDE